MFAKLWLDDVVENNGSAVTNNGFDAGNAVYINALKELLTRKSVSGL